MLLFSLGIIFCLALSCSVDTRGDVVAAFAYSIDENNSRYKNIDTIMVDSNKVYFVRRDTVSLKFTNFSVNATEVLWTFPNATSTIDTSVYYPYFVEDTFLLNGPKKKFSFVASLKAKGMSKDDFVKQDVKFEH
jgi:hypothetical protein